MKCVIECMTIKGAKSPPLAMTMPTRHCRASTSIGEAGGNFNAFAYDDPDPTVLQNFVTKDHVRGDLR